jgi:hypothetical protein
MKFKTSYSDLSHHYIYNNDWSECYGNRMFSEGLKLYSYGHHYLMALRGVKKNGENWIIVNPNGYSPTTVKQLYILHRAIPSDFKTFSFDPKFHLHLHKVFDHYFDSIKNNIESSAKARTRTQEYINAAQKSHTELKEYFEMFKSEWDNRRLTKEMLTVINADDITTISLLSIVGIAIKKAEKLILRQKAAAEKRRKKEIKIDKERVSDWVSGISSKLYLVCDPNTYLRIVKDGIQTSQNLIFTIEECQKLYNCLQKGHCFKGSHIMLNNIHYNILEWNAERLTIGCHKIPTTEINKIAKELKFDTIIN